eukprot:gene17704-20210_t
MGEATDDEDADDKSKGPDLANAWRFQKQDKDKDKDKDDDKDKAKQKDNGRRPMHALVSDDEDAHEEKARHRERDTDRGRRHLDRHDDKDKSKDGWSLHVPRRQTFEKGGRVDRQMASQAQVDKVTLARTQVTKVQVAHVQESAKVREPEKIVNEIVTWKPSRDELDEELMKYHD